MNRTARWDMLAYQRIASATQRQDLLEVLFEDGSRATIEAERLLAPGTPRANWDAMHVTPYEITVSTSAGEVVIPWSTIRVLTDSAYSAHLALAAEDQARRVGRRIRELRERRGWSRTDVAERASISPQTLSEIEDGERETVLPTLQRILAVLGSSFQELVEEIPAPTASAHSD